MLFAVKTAALVSMIMLCALLTTAMPVHAATIRESGISTGTTLVDASDQALDFRLKDMRTIGAKWIRVDFDWSLIQPHDHDTYEWQQYDRLASAASARGIKIMGTLAYTPVWARNVRCHAIAHSKKCSPRSTEEFARFARATVLRFKDKGLHSWEIWNEPNLTGNWKTAHANKSITVDPAAYARTANEAAREIKNSDPRAVVITGGLAPLFEPGPAGMRQSDFLASVLPQLNRQYFAAVGIHPYSWPKLPSQEAIYNAFYTVNNGPPEYNLRTIMAHAGWGDKQIWGTEFGVSTLGLQLDTGTITQGDRPDHVTEAKQAQIIQDGIQRWYAKPNVGPLFIHSDSDKWLAHHKNEGGFGLRRANGSQKPAYDAYKMSVQQVMRQGQTSPQ